MAEQDLSLLAVRALILVRGSDAKPLQGAHLVKQLRSMGSNVGAATGALGNHSSVDEKIKNALDLLVRAGLLLVQHRTTGSQPTSLESYEGLLQRGVSITGMNFTVSDKLLKVQEALGVHSLTELEQRALGNTISIQPLFGQVHLGHTGLFRRSTIFVAMPFREELDSVYEQGITPGIQKAGFSPVRADSIFSQHAIMNQVWNAIYSSYAIIVDCSERNANVFYELGMAHTLGKRCIILAQSSDDIPFDITQFQFLIYENSGEGLIALQDHLARVLKSLKQADAIA